MHTLHRKRGMDMARMERYKQRRGQARLRNALLFLSALVVMAGLASRWKQRGGLLVNAVLAPTATPVAAVFDETMETREIALPEQTWYAIQTGIFTARDAAQRCADTYADRGAPGLVVKEGEKYRVLIASYGQQTDAAAVRERLAREQQVETWLYPWVCPALTLRLTGMAGQLDVAAAGLELSSQTACLLRDAAIELDAGVATVQDTLVLLDEVDGRMKVWADTARSRFTRPYPALLDMELTLAEHWAATGSSLRQTSGSVTGFSAAIKCEAMRLYAQTLSMRASLSGD